MSIEPDNLPQSHLDMLSEQHKETLKFLDTMINAPVPIPAIIKETLTISDAEWAIEQKRNEIRREILNTGLRILARHEEAMDALKEMIVKQSAASRAQKNITELQAALKLLDDVTPPDNTERQLNTGDL